MNGGQIEAVERGFAEKDAEIERLRTEVKWLRAEVAQLLAKEQLTKDLFNHQGNDGSLI